MQIKTGVAMLQILFYENGKYIHAKEPTAEELKTQRTWVQLTAPTEAEVQYVVKDLGVPEEFVRSALDDEERARLDYDDDTGHSLVVFDIPVPEAETDKNDTPYITLPLAVIMKGNLTITVCLQSDSQFNEIKNGTMRKNILLESDKLLYQLLLCFHTKYTKYLRLMDRISSQIESSLSKHTKTEELLRLMKLKNALIYFASSLRQNILVVDKLLAVKNNEDDIETLENIAVEIEQAFGTCNLQRELMTETMDTYSNIMSTRLADTMRILTVVTIILAIPTLIAGLWGMNTKLPIADDRNTDAFWIVVAIMVVFCILALWLALPHKRIEKVYNRKKKRRK
jgi:magnesium transporter